MIKILKRYYLNRKISKYRDYLNSIATIGQHLNESKAYNQDHILHCHIQNFSDDVKRIQIGDYCNLSVHILCNTNARIRIGNYVYMNGDYIRVDHSVIIGSNCLFGPRVTISDTDNHPLSRSARHKQAEQIPNQKIDSYESDGAPIVIGDDVWICMDSLILGGVSIGEGSIIAAHSVVTKDVPPMSIAAGVPAKVIGKVPD